MANKPGKYLTDFTKRMHAKPVIILKDKYTNVIRNNNAINDNKSLKAFNKSFYENVYKSFKCSYKALFTSRRNLERNQAMKGGQSSSGCARWRL